MRHWLSILLFLPTCAGHATAPSETRRTVVFLGDSLTAGLGLPLEQSFPSLIEARLRAERRPWKVVNAGVSGDTTAGGLARLDWIYRQKVDVLVVALGQTTACADFPPSRPNRTCGDPPAGPQEGSACSWRASACRIISVPGPRPASRPSIRAWRRNSACRWCLSCSRCGHGTGIEPTGWHPSQRRGRAGWRTTSGRSWDRCSPARAEELHCTKAIVMGGTGAFMKWLKRIVLILGAALGLGALWAWWTIQRQLPDGAVPVIHGLANRVQVVFDARGVATIKAGSFQDAFRVQGYLSARERLFQMELQRRTADGLLAEIFGPSALPVDRIHRVYGFHQTADAASPQLPEDERDALEAFRDGVNAFIQSHPDRWGLEFQLLGINPGPGPPRIA
ncbi:MAG: penicillin acylase family protein [Holophagaceae bacterium]|nr:penicillin acylase family protein [Holophagaceae bacterium]